MCREIKLPSERFQCCSNLTNPTQFYFTASSNTGLKYFCCGVISTSFGQCVRILLFFSILCVTDNFVTDKNKLPKG